MAFRLTVITKHPNGMAHLAAHGEASAVDFPVNHQSHFEMLLGGQWASQHILVNFDNVPYVDSTAIGWLIQSQKQFRAAGGALVLHSLQPAVSNVFDLLKIGRLIPLAADANAGREVLLTQTQAA